MQYLAIGCRSAVTVVFLLAVAGKTLGSGAFAEFVRSVGQMRAVPGSWVMAVARATVAAEALVALLMIAPTGSSVTVGFGLAAVLTVLVSVTVVRVLRSGRRTVCRCFGRSNRPIGIEHLVRNAVLLLLALTGLVSNPRGGWTTGTGLTPVILAGLFIGLIIASFDDLTHLVLPDTPPTPTAR